MIDQEQEKGEAVSTRNLADSHMSELQRDAAKLQAKWVSYTHLQNSAAYNIKLSIQDTGWKHEEVNK